MLPTNLTKIIEYLFRGISSKFNVNQIARNLKISVGSAYKILKSLEKKGVLLSEKIGNSIYYTLNLESNETEHIVELVLIEGRNKYLAENPYASIYGKDLLDAVKLSKAIVLFGSILETKDAHDVDALFIIERGKAKQIEDFCLQLSNTRPKRINPLLMTVEDFKRNIKKQDKVIAEILKKGVIISGEEIIVKALKECIKWM